MITKEDLAIVDTIPALQAALKKQNDRHLKFKTDEDARRIAFVREFYTIEGDMRKAQEALQRASAALQKVRMEIPHQIRSNADMASSAVRMHEHDVARAKRDLGAALETRAIRQEHAKKGGYKLQAVEVEQLDADVKNRRERFEESTKKQEELLKTSEEAERAIEDEVRKIRKAVLAAR